MAVRFDASTDVLERTTALPASTAFTMCGWGVVRANGGTGGAILAGLSDAVVSNYALLVKTSGTTNVYVDTAGAAAVLIGTVTTDVWFFWALSQNGTGAGAVTGYLGLGTAALVSATNTGDTYTSGDLFVGFNTAENYYDGAHAAVKVWDAVLTAAELEQERWTYRPLRLANLHLWSPFVDIDTVNFRDYSGAGKDWTEGGTVTNEDGPPIAWGPVQRRWWHSTTRHHGPLLGFERNRLLRVA